MTLSRKEIGFLRNIKSYLLIVLLVTCLIRLQLKKSDERNVVNAMTIFFLAIFCAYELSVYMAPYLFHPQRYLVFTLPIASVILIPSIICVLLEKRTSLSVLAMLFIHFIFGGIGKDTVGFISIKPNTRSFFEDVSKLPGNVVIAGWPDGVINNIPLISHRRVFLSYETHQVFHEKFVVEMRKRMNALIEAQFSPESEILLQLKDQFGVTHFLIDKRLYEPELQDKKHRADYFEPFTNSIEKSSKNLKNAYLYRLSSDLCIISHGPLCLIAL